MSTPQGFRDRADDGLFSLLGEVPELVTNLVTAEINSAKGWVKSAGKDVGIGGVWFIVALFLLFWTIPALGAFAIAGLSSWIPTWLAALIVVVVLVILIAAFGLLGLLRVKKLSKKESPAKAIKVNARIVKDVADEF